MWRTSGGENYLQEIGPSHKVAIETDQEVPRNLELECFNCIEVGGERDAETKVVAKESFRGALCRCCN